MQTLSKEEFELKMEVFFNKIKQGSLFIHPTDTIYGIGCDATNHNAVYQLRESKKRYTSPFSVIAPSKEWIKQNCETDEIIEKWIDKLPGPYTLILKLKNKEAIAPNTNLNMDTLGIRIPYHWFSSIVEELKIPTVTTSANVTKENFMTSEEDLDPEIAAKMEFMIYEGEKKGRPSRIVDLTQNELIIERYLLS